MKTRQILIVAALSVAVMARTTDAAGNGNGNGSIAVPAKAPKRAAWQESFTLGPGDVINISIYGVANSERSEIPIRPDGKITYLQAQDVKAAGLTVDELRASLEKELGKFYRAPRTIVTPVAYHSKKYVVMGAVAQKGVFNFNRPMTVLEAIATAGGLETSINQRSTPLGASEQFAVERADLSRSVLMRKGAPVPVNFEKLFQKGDLSQNVPIEPGDVLYFPSTRLSEVYVLGQVLQPGAEPLQAKTTVISAITARGGFSEKAYRQHVLIVRGSINNPETFVVDTKEILSGKTPDVVLQPGDIVFINHRPWSKAEDLLDTAVRAFLAAVVVTTVNVHISN